MLVLLTVVTVSVAVSLTASLVIFFGLRLWRIFGWKFWSHWF
jgi:hypothetical protein